MDYGQFAIQIVFNAGDQLAFVGQNASRLFHKFAPCFFNFGDVRAEVGEGGHHLESLGGHGLASEAKRI